MPKVVQRLSLSAIGTPASGPVTVAVIDLLGLFNGAVGKGAVECENAGIDPRDGVERLARELDRGDLSFSNGVAGGQKGVKVHRISRRETAKASAGRIFVGANHFRHLEKWPIGHRCVLENFFQRQARGDNILPPDVVQR